MKLNDMQLQIYALLVQALASHPSTSSYLDEAHVSCC